MFGKQLTPDQKRAEYSTSVRRLIIPSPPAHARWRRPPQLRSHSTLTQRCYINKLIVLAPSLPSPT